jgi:hypothetical protein
MAERRHDATAAGCEPAGAEFVDPERRERTPPVGAIGYTGTYQEASADIPEVSVVSVLESRGPV